MFYFGLVEIKDKAKAYVDEVEVQKLKEVNAWDGKGKKPVALGRIAKFKLKRNTLKRLKKEFLEEEEKKAELDDLKNEIEETRKEVEPVFLSTYDRVSKIVSRPPYMAPIVDQKCTGCHLRVSNDVVSSVLVEKKITQCDQCGRIVYVER